MNHGVFSIIKGRCINSRRSVKRSTHTETLLSLHPYSLLPPYTPYPHMPTLAVTVRTTAFTSQTSSRCPEDVKMLTVALLTERGRC